MAQNFTRSISKAVPTSGQRAINNTVFANRMVYYERLEKKISADDPVPKEQHFGNFWATDGSQNVIAQLEISMTEKKKQ
ncbi:hypothetical protein NEOLI_000612 [Neolecta irregularis DAH-3]|uniref:Uncharacterized protein n=1 Tax=Neolecta irregularis (strain DAH-3) TaxID=1198029 RepID=A0A1U7LTV8_NEOID|nr:hypothetical protein NEOLI_000612 [Neolecta irregularis DAH-3]|eukprot:OLL26106.1 hypothetical protein NEOLI_000612 [Neolecta irregularis DAH-3]